MFTRKLICMGVLALISSTAAASLLSLNISGQFDATSGVGGVVFGETTSFTLSAIFDPQQDSDPYENASRFVVTTVINIEGFGEYEIAPGITSLIMDIDSGNGGSTDLAYSIIFDGIEFFTISAVYDNLPLDFDVNTPSPVFMSEQLGTGLGYPANGQLLPFSLVGTDDVLLIAGSEVTLNDPMEITNVPVPPALLLFVSSLLAFFGRRKDIPR